MKTVQPGLGFGVCIVGIFACSLILTPVAALGQCEANELRKLEALDVAQGDKFGFSVALDRNTAVISSIGDALDRGSAYVFVRNGVEWIQQAKLEPENNEPSTRFGWSVAMHDRTAIVGRRSDSTLGFGAGAVYVFVSTGGIWSQQAKLLASDGESPDEFGTDVWIQGDTLLVGVRRDDDQRGSAYIFERSGTNWRQAAKLVASDRARLDGFGFAVGMDGDTVAVGSLGDDDRGDRSGSVYIFEKPPGGWRATPANPMTETAKFSAPDGAASDNFGASVSMSGDTVLIGTPGDDDRGSTSGSAYVFVNNGGKWEMQAKLLASDGSAQAQLGHDVSIVGDTAIVAASNEANQAGSGAGSAYVFVRDGTTWTQAAKLLAGDGQMSDTFGTSVSLSFGTVLVGAQNEDDPGNNSGAAYIFGGISDCNENEELDICDIASGFSRDDNGDGIPDECGTCNPCDMNCDGDVNALDIEPFLDLLFGGGAPCGICTGDANGDGRIDALDIEPFLDCLFF